MATIIDISNFSFDKEEVQGINEFVFDEFIRSPALSEIFSIFPNIVIDKELGFIGEGGLVGKAGSGCNLPAQDYSIGTRRILWEPKPWKIVIEQCYVDLLGKLTVYSLKHGVAAADFAQSDYMHIVAAMLRESMEKFVVRAGWFGDTAADSFSGGGSGTAGITNGVDVDYFNLLDGLWKQLILQATSNTAQRVSITENGAANYATQVIPANKMIPYLQDLVYGAPMVLRQQSDAVILCTQKFYDAFLMAIQTLNLENTYRNIVDGNSTLHFSGVPIKPKPVWDDMIFAYNNNGTKLFAPYRALYTTTKVLGLGVDGTETLSQMDVFYDKSTELVKIRAAGQMDAKLLHPGMFKLAI
jgi:hypothetical protein